MLAFKLFCIVVDYNILLLKTKITFFDNSLEYWDYFDYIMIMRKNRILIILFVFLSVFALASCNSEGSTFITTETQTPDVNYITVTGKGVAKGSPDVVKFRISVDEIAPTTSEALNRANQKVTRIYEVLEKYSVKKSDTKTSSLSIGPRKKYDYDQRQDVLLGQGVSETISVRIENTKDGNEARLGYIIDELSAIEAIQINNIEFSVKDEESLYKSARKIAVEKALEKINDFAESAGVTVTEIKTITEGNDSTPYFTNTPRMLYKEATAMDTSFATTSIVSGEFGVSTTVSIVAAFENN